MVKTFSSLDASFTHKQFISLPHCVYVFNFNLYFFLFVVRFIVGNVWLFGDEVVCSNPGSSPVYNLCFAMLIISYIQICLPCIIALCMIPVFCFCMPCLIRMLARLQNENAPKGATDTLINTLPLITITQRLLDDERTCPVCLNDMAIGDEARSLPCRHLFHKNVSQNIPCNILLAS